MIRRIILENYMAHGRTVIDLAAGLTVLVGSNNCGKSAVVHALQTLCYNKPADFAVRHDAKEASVTVETDDGHVLTWRRRKGVVSYVIDGREVGRLGLGGVPDDLHQYLRMPRIDPSNEAGAPFFVHFGLQKSPIFLLDDPPARAATFFAASSDAEKLLEMQKRHRDKVRDARRDHEKLAAEAAELDKRLEASAQVSTLAERIAELESAHRHLIESDRIIEQRTNYLTRFEVARRKRDQCSRTVAAASSLDAPPPFADTAGLRETIDRLATTARRVRREKLRVATAGPLAAPPDWVESAGLNQAIQKLHGAARRLSRARSLGASLAGLAVSPEVGVQKIAGLIKLIAREKECRLRVAAAASDALSAKIAIDALRDHVRTWVEQHPHCPTCGAATDVESVLQVEHQHA